MPGDGHGRLLTGTRLRSAACIHRLWTSHLRGCRGLFTSTPTSQAQSLLLPLLVGQARAVSVSPHASSERYSARSPFRFDTTKPFPPLPPSLALTAASNASDAPDTQHASKELTNPLWPWRPPACHDVGRAHTTARRSDGSRRFSRLSSPRRHVRRRQKRPRTQLHLAHQSPHAQQTQRFKCSPR